MRRRRNESQIHFWHRRVVRSWAREVERLEPLAGRDVYHRVMLEKARRTLEASRRNLGSAYKWPDEDRAMRHTIDEPTSPG